MPRRYYILGPGNLVVPVADVTEWARWYEFANCQIADTEVAPGVRVSTIFLGLDYRYFGDGPPILFETMCFSDYEDGLSRRYCTLEEAEAGHREIVETLRARITQTGTVV